MSRLYPLQFKPIFQERIWGGRAIESLYGKPLPPNQRIGESWEICDRAEAQSVVANGPLAGKTLRWVMEQHGSELLGKAPSLNGRFPLLVKILDAREKLSLQVHPPADKAARFHGEPKTEMWFIADAKPGAELYVGLRRGATRAEFERRIADGSVAECFHRAPVKAGDTMFLPSGRVHAIGSGLVIFEIQQNSDTTFRVFDWNRVDDQGKARQLHVAESLECIDFEDFEPELSQAKATAQPGGQRVVDDPLFAVDLFQLRSGSSLSLELQSCAIVGMVRGGLRIEGRPETGLKAGEFCVAPAALKTLQLKAVSDAEFLVSTPGSGN